MNLSELELKLIELMNDICDAREWKDLYDDICKINDMINNSYFNLNTYIRIKEKYKEDIRTLESYQNNNNNQYIYIQRTITNQQRLLNLRYTLMLIGIDKYVTQVSKEFLKSIIDSKDNKKIELLQLIINELKILKKLNHK